MPLWVSSFKFSLLKKSSMKINWLKIGAIMAMLGVMIGAFGAHALKATLAANGRADTFETAVKYHFYHALGLLLIGILQIQFPDNKKITNAGLAMFVGLLVFSGSLYALCLTNLTFLGAITPLGGVGMIAGWAWLAWAVKK
jgi:uncharacterized membrane protein YgdD (TMEM256/DUF423 family)